MPTFLYPGILPPGFVPVKRIFNYYEEENWGLLRCCRGDDPARCCCPPYSNYPVGAACGRPRARKARPYPGLCVGAAPYNGGHDKSWPYTPCALRRGTTCRARHSSANPNLNIPCPLKPLLCRNLALIDITGNLNRTLPKVIHTFHSSFHKDGEEPPKNRGKQGLSTGMKCFHEKSNNNQVT